MVLKQIQAKIQTNNKIQVRSFVKTVIKKVIMQITI